MELRSEPKSLYQDKILALIGASPFFVSFAFSASSCPWKGFEALTTATDGVLSSVLRGIFRVPAYKTVSKHAFLAT